MHNRFPTTRRLSLTGFLLACIALSTSGTAVEPMSGPRLSPTERMTPACLKATHESAQAFKAARKSLPDLKGLKDHRGILHAHAEDSAHTGGTRPEMLAEAKKAGVDIILLSDHYRPPKDFIADSWRGLREGVLFIPGSEVRGFLAHPMRSILPQMEAPVKAFVAANTEDDGLIFLN